jgi:hypothetical protein
VAWLNGHHYGLWIRRSRARVPLEKGFEVFFVPMLLFRTYNGLLNMHIEENKWHSFVRWSSYNKSKAKIFLLCVALQQTIRSMYYCCIFHNYKLRLKELKMPRSRLCRKGRPTHVLMPRWWSPSIWGRFNESVSAVIYRQKLKLAQN